MKENIDANGGPLRKRDGDASEANKEQFANGPSRAHGHAPAAPLDAWVFLDLLARHWRSIIFGSLAGGALLFAMGWYAVRPKFTASAQLIRYETPGVSEFFKTTTPISSETFAGLMRAPELLQRVGDKVKPPIPPERLTKLIKIDPDSDSDLITVSLAAGNPGEAVELLNTYLEDSVDYIRELESQQACLVASNYLARQVEEMDKDIQVLRSEFRNVPSAPDLTNKLSEVGTNLNALNHNLAFSPRSSALWAMQKERYDKATTELAELLSRYTELHPLVKQKEGEIDALKQQMAQTSTNTALMSAFGPTGTSVGTQPGSPVFNPDLDIIQIKLRALEDGRVQLGNRFHEAQLYAENPPGTVRIHAPATLKTVRSNLRWFKLGIVGLFGVFMGFGASIGIVMLAEFTDGRLKTADDVKRVTRLPVIGTLGDLKHMNAEERSLWAFRTWTMLQGRLSPSANHGLVCGVTSSTHGEGRSTWISLLAEAASMTGFRVLTIATRPSPSHVEFTGEQLEEPEQLLNGEPEPNAYGQSAANSTALTSNVLTSPAQVTDKLTGPNSQPMVHIPLPGWVWNLERRRQWREALNQWRQIENLVILVELPPASVAEAVLLGSNLPNMIWLTESGSAEAAETRDQLETLRNARCNLTGAVLNRHTNPSMKTRFPRWVTAMSAVALLGAVNLQGQETAAPAQPSVQPQTQVTDTNSATAVQTELVTNQPPLEEQPNTNGSFSIVHPYQRAAWQEHLTLGPGDVLNFGIYGQPELARPDITIGPDGRVSYLEAQDVLATGHTIDELRAQFDQELGKYRRGPRTLITPVAFHSKKYYMLGTVMAKGVYTLDRPVTVLEAIARAKGFENGLVDRSVIDLADFSRSFVAREGKRIPVNFEKLFQAGDLSQNIPIEPGDYVYIAPQRIHEVYVVGEIRLPGAVTYTPGMTIMQAITARGGYTDRAYKTRVLVVRGSINHPEAIAVNTHAILDAKTQDFVLKPKDIIYVNSRPFIKVEELADLAATAFIQSLISSWVDVRVVQPIAH